MTRDTLRVQTKKGIRSTKIHSSEHRIYAFRWDDFTRLGLCLSLHLHEEVSRVNERLDPYFPLRVSVCDINAQGVSGPKLEDTEGIIYSLDTFRGEGSRYKNWGDVAQIVRKNTGTGLTYLVIHPRTDLSCSLEFIDVLAERFGAKRI